MKKIIEPDNIKSRVCFAWKGREEKPFWYSTDLSEIHKLGLEPDHNKLFMQKGEVVNFGDEGKGKITEVKVAVVDEYLVQGMSFRNRGEDFPFNFDVIFVVEQI